MLLSELTPFAVTKSVSEPLSRRERLVNLAAVTVPFRGLAWNVKLPGKRVLAACR
jgi:hypothetical protein